MEALANERNPGLREQRVSQQASAKSLERHGPIDSDRQPFRDLQGLVPSLASSYPRYSYAARNRVPVWCSIIAASGSMCGTIAQNYKLPRGSDSSILYGVLPRDYFKRDQLWGPLLGSTAEIAQCGFAVDLWSHVSVIIIPQHQMALQICPSCWRWSSTPPA
jgi:hypothetical protein